MKYSLRCQRSLVLSLFLFFVFAGCQKKDQGPHHFITLHAVGNPTQALFDSAVLVLDQRLKAAYEGDVTVRAEGENILLEVAGRPNLDSLAVLVLSKGGFGLFEMYNNNEVTSGADAPLNAFGKQSAMPGNAELIFALAGDTADIRKQFVANNPSLHNVMFVWGTEDEYRHAFPLYALKRPAGGEPIISKVMINTASPSYDQMGRPSVSIVLKNDYVNTWRDATRSNIGRSIAIRFGNQVLTAPKVAGEISGGKTEISGHFTRLQTRMLAAMIATPDLAAPLQIIHVDTALFVPLQGYPTLRQQARYEMVQNEFLRLRPQIDSILYLHSSDAARSAGHEMERIYRQDIVSIAAETHATQAEVDDFIVKIEEVLEGLKRRLNGEPAETDPESLRQMLETIPTSPAQ